jgi:hypothetical protein
LQFLRRNGSIESIETGVLPGIFIEVQKKMSCVGLRNTLEPDPGNTGVGSFLNYERQSSSTMQAPLFHLQKEPGSLCISFLKILPHGP